MSAFDPHVAAIYAALGRRAPALWWSKLDILLGLIAVGLGLVWVGQPGALAWSAPVLVTLGGYLALAGHRSHIYDAMTHRGQEPSETRLESGLACRCVIQGFALFAACQPEAPRPAASPLTTAAPLAAASPTSGGSIRPEVIAIAGEAYALYSFEFRLASARFEVIDMGMSSELTPVLEHGGATLVVNGGFFDRQRRAEGLVVSRSQELAAFSATLGGGVLVVAKGRVSLHDAIGFALPPEAEFAVQARPRLVVDGARNVQGDDGPRAERTALCVRDGGQAMEVIVVRGEAPGHGPTSSWSGAAVSRR